MLNLYKLLNYRPKLLTLNLKIKRQYITLTLGPFAHMTVREPRGRLGENHNLEFLCLVICDYQTPSQKGTELVFGDIIIKALHCAFQLSGPSPPPW